METKLQKKFINKNPYLINGLYKDDVADFFDFLNKEELMIMIKRGFIGCDTYKCKTINEPYISYTEYIAKDNVKTYKYKWNNVQCPLHKSQSDKCIKLQSINKHSYVPCEFLAHYFTGVLVYSK